MEKRNTNRQREYRDDYRQHSPAWIRAQRRKRKRIMRRRIMIGGAVICVVLIAGVIRIFSGGKSHGKETEASAIEESTFQASDISVNGISLKGMTRSEAKAAIEKEYPWKVTITYNGESIDAENLIDTDLDAFLDGICTGKAEGEYTFAVEDSEDLQSAAAEAAADAAAKWDVKAKNGSISEYDAATDKFLFADGAPGKAVNQEKLIKDLVEAATSGNYDAVIQAEVNESQPELSAANAKEQYKTLSTFTTETTANEKRNTNVKLAARAINGTIVQPGEEFSFNKVVGQRTAEKGYQEAAAYSGGEVVQEPGGLHRGVVVHQGDLGAVLVVNVAARLPQVRIVQVVQRADGRVGPFARKRHHAGQARLFYLYGNVHQVLPGGGKLRHARLLQNVHIEIQDARVAHDERHRVLLALDKALVQVEVILPVRIRYVGVQGLQSAHLNKIVEHLQIHIAHVRAFARGKTRQVFFLVIAPGRDLDGEVHVVFRGPGRQRFRPELLVQRAVVARRERGQPKQQVCLFPVRRGGRAAAGGRASRRLRAGAGARARCEQARGQYKRQKDAEQFFHSSFLLFYLMWKAASRRERPPRSPSMLSW